MNKRMAGKAWVSALILSLALSACGGGGSDNAEPKESAAAQTKSPESTAGSTGPIELTVTSEGSISIGEGKVDEKLPEKEKALRDEGFDPNVAAKKTSAYMVVKKLNEVMVGQNIKLNFQDWGWGEPLIQKETTAFLSKQGPDVIVGETQMPGFAAQGVLEPFPDALADKIRSTVVPAAWKPMELNGKIYGLAAQPGVSMLIWNKKLFKEAGLDPDKAPATWKEFVETAKTITEKGNGKTFGGGIYAGPNYGGYLRFGALLPMNGGGLVDAGNQPIINSGKNAAAFEMLRELNKVNPKGLMASNSEKAFWDAFGKDEIAMVVDGPWRYQVCTDLKKDCGIAALPAPEGGQPGNLTIGAAFFSVPTYAKNKEAGFNFIEAMVSEGVQQVIADAGQRPPVLLSVVETEAYKIKHPELYAAHLSMKGNVQGLPTFNKDNAKAYEEIGFAMAKAMLTDEPIQSILDNAQQKIVNVTK